MKAFAHHISKTIIWSHPTIALGRSAPEKLPFPWTLKPSAETLITTEYINSQRFVFSLLLWSRTGSVNWNKMQMLEPQTARARLGWCRESFINNFGRSFTGHGSFSHFFSSSLSLSLTRTHTLLHTHAHSLSLTLFLTHSDKLFLLLKHTLTLTHSPSNTLSL